MAKHYYRRMLPHIVPPGATLFITFRLAGSLPLAVLAELREARQQAREQLAQRLITSDELTDAQLALHKRLFVRFDAALDRYTDNTCWLCAPSIAAIVADEILRLAELDVLVLSFCIMPNHVHLLVRLPKSEGFLFDRMMQLLKGRTAVAANRQLGRGGLPFWQAESYDHLVRTPVEAERIIAYILNNPTKAGLAAEWREWPFSYLAE